MKTYVVFPPEFVATKYPGYFWNVKTQTLFTAKLGVLRQLGRCRPCKYNDMFDGYRICHQGNRRNLKMGYLRKLKQGDIVTFFPTNG